MLLYAVKDNGMEHYVLETDSDVLNKNQLFLNVNKIYQLLEVKEKGKFLVILFDKEKKGTFLIQEMTGEYVFSLKKISDIMVLEKVPDIKIISRKVYETMIEELSSSTINLME